MVCFPCIQEHHYMPTECRAVGGQILTAEVRARAQVSPRGICGGQSGTGLYHT
jgi:hypothetical protein